MAICRPRLTRLHGGGKDLGPRRDICTGHHNLRLDAVLAGRLRESVGEGWLSHLQGILPEDHSGRLRRLPRVHPRQTRGVFRTDRRDACGALSDREVGREGLLRLGARRGILNSIAAGIFRQVECLIGTMEQFLYGVGIRKLPCHSEACGDPESQLFVKEGNFLNSPP